MEEVSEPDEWAKSHHGHAHQLYHQHTLVFSRANQLKFRRAIETLQRRQAQTQVAGEWEDAANYGRATAEVKSLQRHCMRRLDVQRTLTERAM